MLLTIHEASEEDLEILEHTTDVLRGDLALVSATTHVDFQPGLDEGTFVLCEPLGLFRERWDEPENDQRGDAGHCAFLAGY